VARAAASRWRAAAKKLTKVGFRVSEVEQNDDTVKKDHVIETRPAEGTPLNKGSTVTLVVSSGPEQVTVPDETGKTLDDARSDLENAGFKVSVTRQDTQNLDEDGIVLAQDPDGGQAKKGSTVKIVVGRFNPNLQGDGGTTTPTTTPTTP